MARVRRLGGLCVLLGLGVASIAGCAHEEAGADGTSERMALSEVVYGIDSASTAYFRTVHGEALVDARVDPTSGTVDEATLRIFGLPIVELATLDREAQIALATRLHGPEAELVAYAWRTDLPASRLAPEVVETLARLSRSLMQLRELVLGTGGRPNRLPVSVEGDDISGAREAAEATSTWTANGCTGVPDGHWVGCCNDHDACYCAKRGRHLCDAEFLVCLERVDGPTWYYEGVRALGWLFY